ncbi:FMN-dependent dehydrogenase [Medicago truncatula]|uniref:FMN-dependent dehydrogenase n=1 Tax=Medicago truncatula TaxID=3880 RepID=G7J484_MEDTR|nr:FMN-dependent dehydrogenase [Medicago truncatula]
MFWISGKTFWRSCGQLKFPASLTNDYYESGAEVQRTLQDNRNAFLRILPPILMDVSKIDLTTTVLGMSLKSLVYITLIKILSLFPVQIIYNKTVHSHVSKILFLIYWLHS